MIRLVCDRCGNTSDDPYIYAPEPHPQANMVAAREAMVAMPDGWSNVLGKVLCVSCVDKVKKLIEAIPQVVTRG